MFGRLKRVVAWALAVLQVFSILRGAGGMVGQAQGTHNMTVEDVSDVFSPQWVEEYSGDNIGCEQGRGHYT